MTAMDMPLVGLSSVAAVRVMVKRMSSFLHEEGNSLAGTSVPPSETDRLRSPTANPVHKIALPSCGHTNFTGHPFRSEEHTSELQSLMRISYAVFCLKKKNTYLQSIKTTY